MKRILIGCAVAMLPAFAQAQVLVDMTRITCGEYVSLPPEHAYERNIANVKQYCATAPRDTVMSALERATKR
jgi:hypothetical protein